MAVDLAAPVPGSRALRRAGVLALPAYWLLGGIVALSAVVRGLAALAHVTPYYFPDEYLYPALARGIASGNGPVVRGEVVHFPAMLEPLVTAPFWLVHDPLVALRLTQALHAVEMSLAAVPVFLLARRLGLRDGWALACALFAVSIPDLVYASFTLSDPLAYPLVLTAVYCGVRALDRPTRGAQLAFFAFAALATFTRVQYAALPVAFFAATFVLERHRAFARFRLSFILFGAPLLLVLAAGPGRLLGAYSGIASIGIHPLAILHWSTNDLLVLLYASGVVLVPGALVALFTPRNRVERAFSSLTLGLAVLLVLQAGFIGSFDSHRMQERYVFPLLPLLGPAFALALGRGRRVGWLLAAGVLLLALRVPMSGFVAAHGKDDSQALCAIFRLEQYLAAGNGSLVVALLAAALAFAGALALRSRAGGAVAFGLAVAAGAALSLGAQSYDSRNAHDVRAHDMPADAQWVDHANVGKVTLLEPPGSIPPHAIEALWWNQSIDRELFFGSGTATDHFGGRRRAYIARDGRLVTDGHVVRGPLLVQTAGAQVGFDRATLVARGVAFELLKPDGPARIAMVANGLYSDGWLSREGSVAIWPAANGVTEGTLRVALTLPKGAEPTPMRFGTRRLVVRPGKTSVVTLHVAGQGPQVVRWSTTRGGFASGSRPVSVLSTAPTFTRTSGAVVVCGLRA